MFTWFIAIISYLPTGHDSCIVNFNVLINDWSWWLGCPLQTEKEKGLSFILSHYINMTPLTPPSQLPNPDFVSIAMATPIAMATSQCWHDNGSYLIPIANGTKVSLLKNELWHFVIFLLLLKKTNQHSAILSSIINAFFHSRLLLLLCACHAAIMPPPSQLKMDWWVHCHATVFGAFFH